MFSKKISCTIRIRAWPTGIIRIVSAAGRPRPWSPLRKRAEEEVPPFIRPPPFFQRPWGIKSMKAWHHHQQEKQKHFCTLNLCHFCFWEEQFWSLLVVLCGWILRGLWFVEWRLWLGDIYIGKAVEGFLLYLLPFLCQYFFLHGFDFPKVWKLGPVNQFELETWSSRCHYWTVLSLFGKQGCVVYLCTHLWILRMWLRQVEINWFYTYTVSYVEKKKTRKNFNSIRQVHLYFVLFSSEYLCQF